MAEIEEGHLGNRPLQNRVGLGADYIEEARDILPRRGRNYSVLLFPEAHDAGVVEVFVCGALDVAVGFAGGGGGGKGDAELIGEVQGKAKVFVHEAQRKAGFEVPAEHARGFDVQNAGASHRILHDFDEFFAGKAGALNEGEGFGKSLDFDGEKRVHGELDGLSGAVGAEVKKLFSHGTKDGARGFERCGFATDHEDEFTFFRTPGSAGDGCVEKTDSSCRRSGGDFAGEGGRDGAGVNVDAALFERGEGGFFRAAPEDFF